MRRMPIFLLLFLLALPVGADWLVTKEGARVETKGKWNVKGGVVIFTAPSGTLSSIRLSKVDLDASAAVTMEAKNPPPPPVVEEEEEKPEAVLTLTNADLGPRSASGIPSPVSQNTDTGTGTSDTARNSAQAAQEEDAAQEGAITDDGTMIDQVSGKMEVVRWEAEDSPVGQAVIVEGILRNGGEQDVKNIRLNVNFVDSEGNVLLFAAAQVRSTVIRAGAASTFKAILRDVERGQGEPTFSVTVDPGS